MVEQTSISCFPQHVRGRIICTQQMTHKIICLREISKSLVSRKLPGHTQLYIDNVGSIEITKHMPAKFRLPTVMALLYAEID